MADICLLYFAAKKQNNIIKAKNMINFETS